MWAGTRNDNLIKRKLTQRKDPNADVKNATFVVY
jgi:hypothetical protein